MDVKLKRNFILLGHAHSGKTSLAESMLFMAGATQRKGAVLDGTTVSDYSADEIERKISINSSLLTFKYSNHQIQILDAPGYADFIGEVICGLRAVDAAVVVVDATSSVDVGTEKAWELLEEAGIPRLIFINKKDKEEADIDKALSDIRQVLSKNAVELGDFSSPELTEAVAETDDRLLEKYLEDGKLSIDEVKNALKKAVIDAKVFPILSGSAFTDEGIKELLGAVINYLPSPVERKKLKGIDPKTKEPKEISSSPDAPFCAFVFKSISDPYVGQLTLLRVFAGSLVANTEFYNVNKSSKERIGQIYMLLGKEQRISDAAGCGDIVAIAKLKETLTSDTLADEKNPIIFDKIIFPETAISASVKPKTRHDEEKISGSLAKLICEDPTFATSRDSQTKEQIISGMGDLHLDVMVGRLKKRFNVDVELGTPKVPYKETITKPARIQNKYKKQSGGRGQYGDVVIEIEPLPRGGGFEFVDKIFGGAIPKNFIPSVEKGVRTALAEGAVAGQEIVDMRVRLVDGSYHDVDSSDMAFQIAARMAIRKAMLEAAPVLIEPVMDVEVMVQDEFMGQISGDINARRGRIMGMDSKGRLQIMKAQIPLSEMFKYANDLRSMTGGRGSYTMRFSHYEEVPHKIASTIISQYQATRKHEEE